MSQVDKRIVYAVAALVMVFSAVTASATVMAEERVCDVAADVALELGDYPTAIALHRRLLHSEGNNALAHYHLGFAYGMLGSRKSPLSEIRTETHVTTEIYVSKIADHGVLAAAGGALLP